ncbi:hypothetical protein RFI_05090 [Reticulomyxa filosa]|uniref:Uncharacterized protein n=1 Tax=Reticulomyxa filosa TaxID=46433 RepID=X6P1K9_RETFI|nr:hypothetical protein RFI_05090 [Reticulomyxa filosa]|eukprot:ETO32028.1 hypothetical protein RFI_05090 [Reticulomyxa filosa]
MKKTKDKSSGNSFQQGQLFHEFAFNNVVPRNEQPFLPPRLQLQPKKKSLKEKNYRETEKIASPTNIKKEEEKEKKKIEKKMKESPSIHKRSKTKKWRRDEGTLRQGKMFARDCDDLIAHLERVPSDGDFSDRNNKSHCNEANKLNIKGMFWRRNSGGIFVYLRIIPRKIKSNEEKNKE